MAEGARLITEPFSIKVAVPGELLAEIRTDAFVLFAEVDGGIKVIGYANRSFMAEVCRIAAESVVGKDVC